VPAEFSVLILVFLRFGGGESSKDRAYLITHVQYEAMLTFGYNHRSSVQLGFEMIQPKINQLSGLHLEV
jgi:hypothetical protein